MGILGERHVVASAGADIVVHVSGAGPLVVLMHGWPEQSLSWRHQVPALVAAGYRVAVPDMRGYGESGKPDAVAAYGLNRLADDMQAVAAALGAETWFAVGHDWGAIVAWRCALKHQHTVAAVFCMSVPHAPPPPIPFLDIIEALYPDRFFYIRYIQAEGVAEAEMEAADLTVGLKRIYHAISGEGMRTRSGRHVPRDATLLESFDPAPDGPLAFLPDDELALYVARFKAGGWRGPFNYYRNFPANAAEAVALGDNVVRQPSGFLYGALDPVILFVPGQLATQRRMLADMRAEIAVDGAGHWVQQEAPGAVNAALLEFLNGVVHR
jgi:pimeloyl-ACP methyl ester carboxylesterase